MRQGCETVGREHRFHERTGLCVVCGVRAKWKHRTAMSLGRAVMP